MESIGAMCAEIDRDIGTTYNCGSARMRVMRCIRNQQATLRRAEGAINGTRAATSDTKT